MWYSNAVREESGTETRNYLYVSPTLHTANAAVLKIKITPDHQDCGGHCHGAKHVHNHR